MITTVHKKFRGTMHVVVLLLLAGTAADTAAAAVKDEKRDTDAKTTSVITELVNIPLEWKPRETISSFDAIDLTAFQKVTFMVKPFNDVRKRPAEIGQNVEKRLADRVLLVTTKDNVAAWLTDRFAQVLREFDVDVAKNTGTLSLEADVVKFFVTEESVYKADVALKIRLRSKNNDVLWEGLVSASSTNFGRSYSAENYYEGLSNATITVVHTVLMNEQFKQAIKKNTP
jgi:hypothetical protein